MPFRLRLQASNRDALLGYHRAAHATDIFRSKTQPWPDLLDGVYRDELDHLRVVLSDSVEESRSLRLWFEGSAPAEAARLTGAIGIDLAGQPVGIEVTSFDGVVAAPPSFTPASIRAVPNPFNPRTTIWLEMPTATAVNVEIFDAAGRRVRQLARGLPAPIGPLSLPWDGSDDRGERLASGVYFVRAVFDGQAVVQKLSLLK
jgi:FlgD Ig-like domain